MKTVIIRNHQHFDRPIRCSDIKAAEMVRGGNYEYCPKHLWTGVFFSTREGRWISTIYSNGKRKQLGLFDSLDEAIAARLAANKEYGFHENHGKSHKTPD